MDQALMKATLEVDEHHWWYRGRRRIIQAELDRLPLSSSALRARRRLRIGPDAPGAGALRRGARASSSARTPPRSPRAEGYGEVHIGRLEDLPWDEGTFDLITCLDVIEHTPDDRVDAGRAAAGGEGRAYLLVTVPAYQALWSLHDEANHHYRRYGRETLRAASRRCRLGR